MTNERYIRGEACNALVYILEWLLVRQIHHDEKGLLEGVDNRRGGIEHVLETLFCATSSARRRCKVRRGDFTASTLPICSTEAPLGN
jgi:hypothetical protein